MVKLLTGLAVPREPSGTPLKRRTEGSREAAIQAGSGLQADHLIGIGRQLCSELAVANRNHLGRLETFGRSDGRCGPLVANLSL